METKLFEVKRKMRFKHRTHLAHRHSTCEMFRYFSKMFNHNSKKLIFTTIFVNLIGI